MQSLCLMLAPKGTAGVRLLLPDFYCSRIFTALQTVIICSDKPFLLFFTPPPPSPLHPFLIAASNSHTHSSLLTRPFGISTWHLQSCSPWKGKEKKIS